MSLNQTKAQPENDDSQHTHKWRWDSSLPVLGFGPKGVRSYWCPCGARGQSDGITGAIKVTHHYEV